jgi:hypothetical protein
LFSYYGPISSLRESDKLLSMPKKEGALMSYLVCGGRTGPLILTHLVREEAVGGAPGDGLLRSAAEAMHPAVQLNHHLGISAEQTR